MSVASDYVLYAGLALLVVALLSLGRAKRRRRRRKALERMRSTPASNTLLSTLFRPTRPGVSARKEMRSDQAHSTSGGADARLDEDWVRAPNSITGVRKRDPD